MKTKMHIPEVIPEILAWLSTLAGLNIIGGLIGFMLASEFDKSAGIVLAVAAAVLVMLFGLRVAIKSQTGKGILQFLSRAINSSQLDHKANRMSH